jgi:hypothetical protein
MRLALLRCIFGLLAAVAFTAEAAPASGYWWNPAEAGRGFVIEIQGNQMFMAGFLYAASGEATWVASSGPMTSSTQYSGPLTTYRGGQTLAGAYKPATEVTPALGTLAITFTSDTEGSLTWPGGTVPIQRYDFGPGGSAASEPTTNPQSGWWWNVSEGGRGFAIEVQGGTMYLAGYMYDPAGNATWYLASGAMTSAALFQGQWAQYAGGQTLTGPYQPASVVNSNVGYVTLQFIDTSTATLTLPNQVQIPLTRFNFGLSAPVLAAFSPSSAVPASLVTLTGSGIDPSATLTLTLSDNMGYTVSVPLAFAATGNIQVSVPPYYNAVAGGFGAGTVSMTLTQSSGGASTTSNTLNGLAILSLPAVPGTPGNATLSLIQANLNEAQKLQNSIKGTAQDTAAVNAALAQQVTNLLTLVGNVESVVQNGLSFTLGIIGGANIKVDPSNIGQVDSFILATLQALATPGTGSLEKGAQQATGPGCMGAQASAFANALIANAGDFTQLAQNLIEAPLKSSACNTAAAFSSAYQIFGGAGGTSIGITNEGGATGSASAVGGVALFAAATTNADTAVGINALIGPALASQTGAVQNGIGTFSALIKPVTDQLLAVTTGDLGTNVGVAQNLILTVAPPPSAGGPLAVSGTYSGSATATSPLCQNGNNLDSGSINLIAQITTQGNSLSGTIENADPGQDSSPATVTGTYNAGSSTWSVSINKTNSDGEVLAASGTISGNLMSGTLADTGSPQDPNCPGFTTYGVFALTKQ